MAKKSMINREIKREKTVVKYAARRAELKKSMLDLSLTVEEREAAAINDRIKELESISAGQKQND